MALEDSAFSLTPLSAVKAWYSVPKVCRIFGVPAGALLHRRKAGEVASDEAPVRSLTGLPCASSCALWQLTNRTQCEVRLLFARFRVLSVCVWPTAVALAHEQHWEATEDEKTD